MKLIVISCLVFIFSSSSISSQTIHRDDLKKVRIAYDFKNIQDRKVNNFITPKEWTLDFNIIDEQIWVGVAPQLSNLWFSLYIEDKLEIPTKDTFFISTFQNSGLNLSKSIITSWNVLNNDSLEYINAFAYNPACSPYSKIEYQGKFPDSSNYLITSTYFDDFHNACDAFYFLKEVKKQHFVIFHSLVDERRTPRVTSKSHNGSMFDIGYTHEKPELITSNLKYNNYRIFKKNQFEHINPKTVDGVSHTDFIIDSIHIEPIDIWELAKKHFNIVEP